MKPYFETERGALYCGNALDILKQLPPESVQTVVTSPPYWGLRDYGTATWKGGQGGCDHKAPAQYGKTGIFADGSSRAQSTDGAMYGCKSCPKCGATRIDSQLGLEDTPEEYVKKMVEVFRGVRRVLRDDGTVWLNLGDSYCGGGRGGDPKMGIHRKENSAEKIMKVKPSGVLKTKDLVGIPWMLAFALRADGWYLRQDIIWHKPNPMPEPVRDRCTKAHEYIFLLSKNQKYYYDADAIREENETTINRPTYTKIIGNIDSQKFGAGTRGERLTTGDNGYLNPAGRNKRSVWTVSTQPYSEAHFATFPEALIKPCILAGAPEGGVVLDMFMGAGTVALVCEKSWRRWIGIELSPDYCPMIVKRIDAVARQGVLEIPEV